MAVLRGGWDSGRGAGPAPSGKRRFWLRFGPFGATSVVPPTEAPWGEIPAPQEDSTEPPSLPPGRPAASPSAAQGLPPGRPGLPPRPARMSSSAGIFPGSINFRTSRLARALRPLAQRRRYSKPCPATRRAFCAVNAAANRRACSCRRGSPASGRSDAVSGCWKGGRIFVVGRSRPVVLVSCWRCITIN